MSALDTALTGDLLAVSPLPRAKSSNGGLVVYVVIPTAVEQVAQVATDAALAAIAGPLAGKANAGDNGDIARLLGVGGAGIDFLASSTTVASAATVDLGALTTRKVQITGTATISSFGTQPHRERLLHFTGACTLTHNATSLILPGSALIVTAAGDTAVATSDASGAWRVRDYARASGKPIVGPVAADITDAGATGRAVLAAADPGAAAVALGLGPSFRNRLRNAGFTVNQRAVSGTVTLVANAYGHDGFKAGANGCTYTFARSGGVTMLTISAGTLVQVIEGALYMTEGGTYTASWLGTAQGRLNGGAYAASPIVATGLAADANLTVEWGTGSLALPQVETGKSRTVFELRDDEMRRCLRYFQRQGGGSGGRSQICLCLAQSSSQVIGLIKFETEMRVQPTTMFSAASNYRILGNGGAASPTTISANEITNRAAVINLTASVVMGTALLLQAVDNPTSPAVVDFSAEL